MTNDINNPLVSHCFLFTMALKGMEPAPNQQRRRGSKKLEGGSFKFVTLAPQHERKWLNCPRWKQNIHQHKDKSCNLKNKQTNSSPNWAVWTVFVNCAHWRGSTLAIYKTVLIIFPLNLQTITITFDVVKWRWGGNIHLGGATAPPVVLM